jgi:hypothetical protein
MLFLAKATLGICGTLTLAGAYLFHEGVIRVDVDESRDQGSHVHLWVPAAVLPVALYLAPRDHLEKAAAEARPLLPALRQLSKELKKYPNAELIDVREDSAHVRVAARDGRLYIDAASDSDNIHVSFPVETISDIADRLESATPKSTQVVAPQVSNVSSFFYKRVPLPVRVGRYSAPAQGLSKWPRKNRAASGEA